MDYGKMKVVELRAELQARGLDTKGVKAALIDRLKEALDLEEQQTEGGAPKVSTPAAPETPRALRRNSRSRTRSPEPVVVKPVIQDPQLQAVSEEPEEAPQQKAEPAEISKPAESEQKDTEMYEKIIDEMDADDNNQQQEEIDEDALLEETESSEQKDKQEQPEQPEQEDQNMETADGEEKEKEQQTTTDEENRGVKRRSNSPAKGESPKKKQRLPPPNIDDFVNDEDEPELDENSLQLSWFDSDLNLKIDRDTFTSAISLWDTGLALVWAGARANYGAINNGKYFYEVQIQAHNNKISYPNEKNLHEIRCGWSTSRSSLQLGESEFSYGLDSSGKKCCNSEFTEYGIKANVHDIIGVHLNLTDDKSTIQFTINGKDQGIAFEFEKSSLNNEALFPHISTKNIEYKVNFGQHEESLWSLRRDGHKESELKRRRKELENKKKELEKKREDKAEKLRKQKEAEAEKAEKATTSAEQAKEENKEESTEEKPSTEGAEKASTEGTEKPAEEAEKPAEETEKPAETEQTAIAEEVPEEPEPVLPDDITEAEIDADTPHNSCLDGYTYIGSLPITDLSKGPRRPEVRTDCEVIMMIGLPGAGKSHWALERAKEFPEKRYTLLGTKYLLERMKILGKPRKPNSGPGRWEKLIELCNRGLLTLNEIACKRRRNYILDQPHVYISDQRRKMRVYGDFKRIAAIIVPAEEEYKRRAKQRLETEGKDIPEAAINEMRANITLPELEYMWFNEILYTDLEKEPAVEEVKKENERGKKALNQRNRQNNFNRRGGSGDFNNRNNRQWGGQGGQNRNDFRRNDRWGPPNQRQMPGAGYRRDFDFNGGRGRNNWSGPDNWMNRQRGGYGGAPPPRPGQKRQQDNRQQNQRNDRSNFRQGQNQGQGGSNNSNRNNQNRRQDGNKKFGGGNKNDWAQGGGWGGNWGNYGGQAWGGNQWNQNQYGGSNSSADNSNDQSQSWMTYYQQSPQQISQNWYSDTNYGGAFSSNSNYDSNQSKQ
ncbi:unnamed protein product [Chironomus riparius]|uniref:Uncharacterized protein n=1 Tax=Chironomus riparius TaxID=315576 RepID=A0A9P0IYC2_9DIPT|nr:unnamed protein product [Chironomus riparius]